MKPYIQEFDIPGGPISTVVMDKTDFDDLVQIIKDKFGPSEHIDNIVQLQHIPMIGRGTKTQELFDKFGVTTDRMSVIVRGQGPELLKKLRILTDPERN